MGLFNSHIYSNFKKPKQYRGHLNCCTFTSRVIFTKSILRTALEATDVLCSELLFSQMNRISILWLTVSMTLKTKHSSAAAQCLMVNAAAAHNSSQCTSARHSWTEALYFPNAISLFYRQAFSCQTQTFQILLLFCLEMKSYSILQVMILMLSLPNYRTKYISRNTASVAGASAPTVKMKIFGQRISNFLPWYNSNSLASSKLLKINYRGNLKTGKWRKSHGSLELLPSPKRSIKMCMSL